MRPPARAMARAMTAASQSAANSRRRRNPFGNFMRRPLTSKGRRLRPYGLVSYRVPGFFATLSGMPLARLRQGKPDAARRDPYAAARTGRPTLARARPALDRLPKAAHFFGRRAVRVELGHAPAEARGFRVVHSRKNERGDQLAHLSKRLNAVLDAGGLMGGRALIEQEHEPGPDLLERRARSGAGPQVEQARPRRDDVEVGRLHRSRRRGAFRARGVKDCERHALALEGREQSWQARRARGDDVDIARGAGLGPLRERALRIHVDDADVLFHFTRRDSQRRGDRAFPRAALLTHKRYRPHHVRSETSRSFPAGIRGRN